MIDHFHRIHIELPDSIKRDSFRKCLNSFVVAGNFIVLSKSRILPKFSPSWLHCRSISYLWSYGFKTLDHFASLVHVSYFCSHRAVIWALEKDSFILWFWVLFRASELLVASALELTGLFRFITERPNCTAHRLQRGELQSCGRAVTARSENRSHYKGRSGRIWNTLWHFQRGGYRRILLTFHSSS